MEEHVSRKRFIRLGGALGMSVAGASLLAACGGAEGASDNGGSTGGSSGGSTGGSTGDKSGGSGDSGNSPETTGASAGSSGGAIASESEVASGSAKPFKDSGKPAVLVHLESGDFVAYSAVCTHQGCTVAYKNGQLACPCHGSLFDPAKDGEVLNGPAQQPLPKIPIKVEGGKVVKA